jgi:molybdenum cofactor cytidylyltransferase
MPDIIGIMLAAGRGTRFDPTGQRNKLLAPLPDGRTVLRASCANLLPWVDRLVVVTGAHGAPLRAALADLPLAWVESDRVDLGMGASLKAGVGATDPGAGWLFALGDMPYITPVTLCTMRDALRAGVRLARPAHGGQPGHPVACAAALREALLQLPDAAGVAALARRDPALMSSIAVDDAGCVRDVDVPGDLG